MESRAKFLGHAIHPILIVFPFGLLATAVIFDTIYLIWGNPEMARVGFWMMIAGVIGGLVAAPFGTFDWLAIPAGTRAKRVGLLHGLANVIALIFFAGSVYLRYDDAARPQTLAHALSFIGIVIAGVGGWLGGELVERLGIGVHENAHADAPSSLSSESPTATTR